MMSPGEILRRLPKDQQEAYQLDLIAFGQAAVMENPDGSLRHLPVREVYRAMPARNRSKIIMGWVVVGAFVVLAIATLMGVWEPPR